MKRFGIALMALFLILGMAMLFIIPGVSIWDMFGLDLKAMLYVISIIASTGGILFGLLFYMIGKLEERIKNLEGR